MPIDKDFIYVTNSLHRIDIIMFLNSVDFVRNYELADILGINPSYVSQITEGLSNHNIIMSEKYGKARVYSLTQKGKEIANKLKDYHGVD